MKREFLKELGINDEVVNQIMQEYGKDVNALKEKAEKFETLKADNKALETKYQTDVAEFTKKLNDAVEGTKDYDVLKQSLETLKADNQKSIETYQKDLMNTKMDSAIDVALIKSNVDEKYIPLLKTQVNRENLKIENDAISGLDTTIATLQAEYPKMFGEIKKMGNPPSTDGKTPDLGKKAQLIEQYNQAEKKGDVKLRFSLLEQIKQIKE